jgi:hypothetical protein
MRQHLHMRMLTHKRKLRLEGDELGPALVHGSATVSELLHRARDLGRLLLRSDCAALRAATLLCVDSVQAFEFGDLGEQCIALLLHRLERCQPRLELGQRLKVAAATRGGGFCLSDGRRTVAFPRHGRTVRARPLFGRRRGGCGKSGQLLGQGGNVRIAHARCLHWVRGLSIARRRTHAAS